MYRTNSLITKKIDNSVTVKKAGWVKASLKSLQLLRQMLLTSPERCNRCGTVYPRNLGWLFFPSSFTVSADSVEKKICGLCLRQCGDTLELACFFRDLQVIRDEMDVLQHQVNEVELKRDAREIQDLQKEYYSY